MTTIFLIAKERNPRQNKTNIQGTGIFRANSITRTVRDILGILQPLAHLAHAGDLLLGESEARERAVSGLGWGAVRGRGVGHGDRGLLVLVLVATPVAQPRRRRQHSVSSPGPSQHTRSSPVYLTLILRRLDGAARRMGAWVGLRRWCTVCKYK